MIGYASVSTTAKMSAVHLRDLINFEVQLKVQSVPVGL